MTTWGRWKGREAIRRRFVSMRTGFVVRARERLSKGIISVYEYLKAIDPVTIETLGYMDLFSETVYLAGTHTARYAPAPEKLTAEELRYLMAAPGEGKRSGAGSEASA